jgi:hypothetical protein
MAQSPLSEGQAQESRIGTRSNQSTINGLLDVESKSGIIQLAYSSSMIEIRKKKNLQSFLDPNASKQAFKT